MRRVLSHPLSGASVLLVLMLLSVFPAQAAGLRQTTDTETPTATATAIPPSATPIPPSATAVPPSATAIPPSATPAVATATPVTPATSEPLATASPTADLSRALILATYNLSGKVVPGHNFELFLDLRNQGAKDAYNVIVTIQGDKLIPRDNGGVQAIGRLNHGRARGIRQGLYATPDLAGQAAVTITINVAYTDSSGTAYSTPLLILVNLKSVTATTSYSGAGGAAGPSRTPTAGARSKLIISAYKTDLEKLQAGNLFNLDIEIQNQGNALARNVTMVLGGSSGSTRGEGTPETGGVSGGGADLSKFAPVGSSNLYNLGDLAAKGTLKQTLHLVVNVSTEAGVYPFKISFVYQNAQGESVVDDQIITLLVYALPQITVSFYDTVADIGIGELRTLPIQITNTGKKSTILGEVTVSASRGTMNKNTATVGTVDTGGYFTMDPEFVPEATGEVTLTVQVKYTDDFRQPGVIEKTLTVNIVDTPTQPGGAGPGLGQPGSGGGGGGGGEVVVPAAEESLTDRLWKAVLGFLGLSGG